MIPKLREAKANGVMKASRIICDLPEGATKTQMIFALWNEADAIKEGRGSRPGGHEGLYE